MAIVLAVPSRSNVPQYQLLKRKIDESGRGESTREFSIRKLEHQSEYFYPLYCRFEKTLLDLIYTILLMIAWFNA